MCVHHFNKHISSNLFTEAFRNYQLSLLFCKVLLLIIHEISNKGKRRLALKSFQYPLVNIRQSTHSLSYLFYYIPLLSFNLLNFSLKISSMLNS